MTELARSGQGVSGQLGAGNTRWTPREPKAPMGAEAAVVEGNEFPGQTESFACVEAENDEEWHFGSSQ